MPSRHSSEKPAQTLGRLLASAGSTLAVAESCTGGMIGAALTAIPGSSRWFTGGIIAYDNQVKITLLGVSKKTLDTFGAVSEQAASAMAQGAAKTLAADYAIAVTGVAGPDGGTNEKPVGLVFIGIFHRGKTAVYKHVFTGDRKSVREQAVEKALQHCIEAGRQ